MSTPAFSDNADVGHFIGGEHVAHADARTQPVFNPATGAVARQLHLGTVGRCRDAPSPPRRRRSRLDQHAADPPRARDATRSSSCSTSIATSSPR